MIIDIFSFGNNPFSRNSSTPKGGVDSAISQETIIIRTNHTLSKPNAVITGMKMGRVMSMMELVSMKQPKTKTTSMKKNTISFGDTSYDNILTIRDELREHADILQAVKERNVDKAIQLLKEHISVNTGYVENGTK